MATVKKGSKKVDAIVVELDGVDPKRHVIKFTSDDSDAAMSSAYITKEAVEKLEAWEGVKITIEAL